MKVLTRAAIAAALTAAFLVLLSAPAFANSGTVTATQTCDHWSATITLNHNVETDRSVDIITTIPGTAGTTGTHYNTNFGQIWHEEGTTPTTGTVTLNIYYPGAGGLEFTQSATLPTVTNCEVTTTTTTEPTTTTTVPQTTTTIPKTTTTLPKTTTTKPDGTTTTTAARVTTTTAAPPTLPLTGGSSLPLSGVGGLVLVVGGAIVGLARHKKMLHR